MGKIYLQYLDGPSHSFNHFKNNNNNNNNNSTLTKTDDDDQDMNNNNSNNSNNNSNVIHKVFTCSNCDTHLSRNEDIISKNFHGRHGKAYLFNRAVNVSVGPNEQRTLMTGLHVVCDIYCNQCETIVGWKYERAQEPSQRYKIGKFILEKAKLRKDRNWGRASPFSLVDHPRHPRHLQSMHQKTSNPSHFISAFVDQSEASVAVDNKRMGSLTGVGVNHVRFATDEDDDLMMTMNSNGHMNSNSSSSSVGGSSSSSSNIHFGNININNNNNNSGSSSIMLTVVPNDVTSETNNNNDTGRGNNSNNSRRRQRIRARNPQALTYLINSRTTRSDDTDEDDDEEEASIEAFYVDDHEENFEEEEEEEVEAEEEEEEEIDEGVEQRIRSEATGAIERVLNLLSQSTRGGMTSSGGGASRRGRPRDDDDDEEL